jgi:predicted nucleic acid-binding protein
MIVVVADTSPLNYLVEINCQDVLPALYERVLVASCGLRALQSPASLRAMMDF